MKRKTYWVYLNGKYIAEYRTLRGCLDFIERRKLEANYDNDLGIIDNEGNEYHPYTGKMMNESINEWNMWDGDRRSSYPRQTRMIDVADKMRREQSLARKERYNNDAEYHEHIKRLEDELRRTDDPQHAEYLERRISKLKSLSEGVKLSRTSRAYDAKVNNKLNEDFSFVKDKMTYEEIVKAFFKLYLREPLAEITSEKYPEVKELINYLPDVITTETGGLQKVNKSYGIKFIIGYNGKIYLCLVRIDGKYNREYWTKIDIRTLPEKYAQNCLNCLLKILHRLKKENEESGAELTNNNENIKQLNLNANKIYTDTDYYYDGEFYIKSCSFEQFIKRHPLTVINRTPGRYDGKAYYDYELGGDFNDKQYEKSGRRQPELVLYGRYFIDDNTFEIIYDNPWEGTYTHRKVDYIPIDAFVRKPR